MGDGKFLLDLIGPFRLRAPGGGRINIASRKGQALLAMLAVAGNGERTRSWLQGQLWGSRAPDQAQASLRSEVSTLRTLINSGGDAVLHADKNRIWIDLARMTVDARDADQSTGGHSFLEGLDIPEEEAFEEWLRDERARLKARQDMAGVQAAAAAPTTPVANFTALAALAVLPFANLTGDPAQNFLAEGISEDLIDRLARLRWMPIIARGSSFAFREPDPDPRLVGRALGARYVVEGRLRRQGRDQFLSAALADSESGQSLWSTKMAVRDAGSSELLEDLLTNLTAALGGQIDQHEQVRALRKPQSDLNVRDLIWRGRWHANRMTREDAAAARACFDAALAQEPKSPEAIIQSVWAHVWDIWARRGTEAEILEVRQRAQKAIIADCDDARGHMLAGIAEIWLHQPLRAEALLRRAIDLNPSLAMAHAQLGASLRVRDENAAAVASLRAAIRLSPNDHDMFFIAGELAASLLMLGDHDAALVEADHAIARRRGYWFPYVIKVNALVRLGRIAEARQALAELHEIKADFRPAFIRWSPFADPKNIRFLEDGLNQAAG